MVRTFRSGIWKEIKQDLGQTICWCHISLNKLRTVKDYTFFITSGLKSDIWSMYLRGVWLPRCIMGCSDDVRSMPRKWDEVLDNEENILCK